MTGTRSVANQLNIEQVQKSSPLTCPGCADFSCIVVFKTADFFKLEQLQAISFLQNHSLLPKVKHCPNCDPSRMMKLEPISSTSPNYRFKCSKCKIHRSLRSGTFFENFNMCFVNILKLLHLMFTFQSATQLRQITGCGLTAIRSFKKQVYTITQFAQTRQFEDDYKKWSNLVVDETCVSSKRKYNRGKRASRLGTQWMLTLCLVNDATGKPEKFQSVLVTNRSHSTLIPSIEWLAAPGAVIRTDELRTYSILKRYGYDHRTVNHKKEYTNKSDGVIL